MNILTDTANAIDAFNRLLEKGILPGFVISFIGWGLFILSKLKTEFFAMEPMLQSTIESITMISTLYFLAMIIYKFGGRAINIIIRCVRTICYLRKGVAEDEKNCLRPYVTQRKKIQFYFLDDGAPQALEKRGILHRVSTVSSGPNRVPYCISDIAYNYLLKHPNLLEAIEIQPEETEPPLPEW